MIGYFPDPYPDELLYSVCARFADRVQYPSKWSASRELFGSRRIAAAADLPGYLGVLTEALPPEHCCKDGNRLIDKHTLLPFYGPFFPNGRLDLIRADMLGSTSSIAYMRSGLIPICIPSSKWFRFCPVCVKEDRDRLGECYWHRVPQVSGVEICPIHHVFLEDSQTRRWNSQTRYEFISAERSVGVVLPRVLAPSDPRHKLLLGMARDVMWLLEQPRLTVCHESLRQRYKVLLADHGLASYTGIVNRQALLNAFRAYYPSDFLASLYCELAGRENWLFRLLGSKSVLCHPIRHLLLVHFLGHTIETFFELPTEHKPFGEGPWPCLNFVSDHYRQPTIQECQIRYDRQDLVVGTFACSCGFVYVRRGPDQSAGDRFRVGRYESFGPVWETELKKLWEEPTISLVEMAHRLGVDRSTVTRQAAKLGLPFPHPGSKVPRPITSDVQVSSIARRHEYRTKLLVTIQAYPGAGRLSLYHMLPKEYPWLLDNDREWLMEHVPPRRMPIDSRTKLPAPRVNWEERDVRLAQAVKMAAQNLKNAPGQPVRITVQSIGREVDELHKRRYAKDKLPLTFQVLSDVVETHEELAIRRLEWVAELYRQESAIPKKWRFMKRAGLKRKFVAESPQVKEALDKALQMLGQYNGVAGVET